MAQHDYDIANQTAANFRTDLNNALDAIVSTNSGTSAPSTTFANQLWYDTTNNILKMRNEADTAWIDLFDLDQSGNLSLQSNIASQAQAEAGTASTVGMTPQRTKQAIDALSSAESYSSTAQTLTASGHITLAHSLSATPRNVVAWIKCTTAELGYSVGDEVLIGPSHSGIGSQSRGIAIIVDGTNIEVIIGSGGLAILNFTDESMDVITLGSWDLYVDAWIH